MRVLGEVLDQDLKPLLCQGPLLEVQVAGASPVQRPVPFGGVLVRNHLLEVDHSLLPVLDQVLALAGQQQRLAPLVPLGEVLQQDNQLGRRLGIPLLAIPHPAELIQQALADGRFLDHLQPRNIRRLGLGQLLLVTSLLHRLADPKPALGHQ